MMTEVTSKDFASATSKGVVIVDFFATWCMPCQMQKTILDSLNDLTIVSVDVDKCQDLAIRFKVMSIPTLLILKDGEIKAQFVGLTQEDEIQKAIKSL